MLIVYRDTVQLQSCITWLLNGFLCEHSTFEGTVMLGTIKTIDDVYKRILSIIVFFREKNTFLLTSPI